MLPPLGLGGGLRCGVGLYTDWVLMGLLGLLASTDLQTHTKNHLVVTFNHWVQPLRGEN